MLCRGVLQNRMVLPVHWQTLLQGSSEPEDVSRRRRGCHVDDPPLHTLAGYRFQRGRLTSIRRKIKNAISNERKPPRAKGTYIANHRVVALANHSDASAMVPASHV